MYFLRDACILTLSSKSPFIICTSVTVSSNNFALHTFIENCPLCLQLHNIYMAHFHMLKKTACKFSFMPLASTVHWLKMFSNPT